MALAAASASFSCTLPCPSMVTSARLRWVLDQLVAGRRAHLLMNTYEDKVVVKIKLSAESGHFVQNGFAINWITAILSGLHTAVAVDHGHGASSGESFVNILLKPLHVQSAVVSGMTTDHLPTHGPADHGDGADAQVASPPVALAGLADSPDTNGPPTKFARLSDDAAERPETPSMAALQSETRATFLALSDTVWDRLVGSEPRILTFGKAVITGTFASALSGICRQEAPTASNQIHEMFDATALDVAIEVTTRKLQDSQTDVPSSSCDSAG